MRIFLPHASRPEHAAAQVALAAALPTVGGEPVMAAPADAACAFDADDALAAAPPRVAMVDALAPSATSFAWRDRAERFAAIDAGAAEALVAAGVPRERVVVTGWPLASTWHEAGRAERDGLRRRFGLAGGESTRAVSVVDTRGLDEGTLIAIVSQLALATEIDALFDAPEESTAALLRARCVAAGIRARRFAESSDTPLLWRASDLAIVRPRAQAVAQARAVGLAVVALAQATSPDEAREAEAIATRGFGRAASVATLAAALRPWIHPTREALDAARAAALAGATPDAARALARLCVDTAEHAAEILAEPPLAPVATGPLEEIGVTPEEDARRRRAERAAAIERSAAEKELEERLAALKARLK